MFNTFDDIELNTVYFFNPLLCCHCFQGLDEEALVDHGKTSFTTLSNYETEDLESKYKASQLNVVYQQLVFIFCSVINQNIWSFEEKSPIYLLT